MTGPTSRSRQRTAHRLRPGRPERDVLVVPVLAHHRPPVVHVRPPPHVPAEGLFGYFQSIWIEGD
jgi:hypothetical protein